MRFIDDDGKMPVLVLRAKIGQREGELLDGSNDDPFAIRDGFGEIPGMLRPFYRLCHLHKLLNGIADLFVQDSPVGDHDDGIDHRVSILHQANQLMGQPRNGIRLAAARAVLNQVATPDAMLLHIPEQRFHHVQLMIAGEDLFDGLLFCLRVCFLDHLGIVFNDAAKFLFGQDILPQVIRHEPIRVGWIASAVVVTLVEGQEPAVLSGQLRAELDAGVVYSEVHHAALEGKQLLMRVAVILILLHSVIHVLFGELVLQLEGHDRQTVDENAQIQRQSTSVNRVAQLPGDTEDVFLIHLRCMDVALGRGQVKHDQVGGISLDTVAEHVNDASLGQFALQAVQEVTLLLLRLEHAQLRHLSGLGVLQEAEQPCRVHCVFLIVVGVGAFLIAIVIREPPDDEGLQAVFPRIRKSWHSQSS